MLYEDKKYYPEIEEIYPNVEAVIEEEDTMAITESIVKDVVVKKFDLVIPKPPQFVYKHSYFLNLIKNPELIRNIAIVGHLHHGKTQLLDTIVEESTVDFFDDKKHKKFTDARRDEQDRLISIKATPYTTVLEDSKGKNYVLNIIDTPGHPDFSDEQSSGLRLSDGAVVVIDAIEGVMMGADRALRYCVQEQIPVRVQLTIHRFA